MLLAQDRDILMGYFVRVEGLLVAETPSFLDGPEYEQSP